MKKISFKKAYLIYVAVLAVLVIVATLYINRLLHQYEDSMPEQIVKKEAEELQKQAAEGTFFETYTLPEVSPGVYEEHLDVKRKYLAQFLDGEFVCVKTNEAATEDELVYAVEKDGAVIAKVKLQAMGPAETKLAVLNFRDWQVSSVEPVLEKKDYTLSVPADFAVAVNGVELTTADGEQKDDEIVYTIKDVYLVPDFAITDKDGNQVSYTVDKQKVKAEFYYYTLVLPTSLTVEVNGEILTGEETEKYRVRYDIKELVKPTVNISDCYGNVVSYEGGDKLPLTYLTLTADSRYGVTVAGQPVADKAVTVRDNSEYAALGDFVSELPRVKVYDIAILDGDAKIAVTDENGEAVAIDGETKILDLTTQTKGLTQVPADVAEEIDVLSVAKTWSLFMTEDASFSQLEPYLIEESYQYQVVLQYATGVDRTFTSAHTLANPAFTDEVVTNYVQIADNCFSVDISFVKHMILSYGARVDDPMNDRFYFVKYDDTDDGTDNPTWRIASMKEIVNND